MLFSLTLNSWTQENLLPQPPQTAETTGMCHLGFSLLFSGFGLVYVGGHVFGAFPGRHVGEVPSVLPQTENFTELGVLPWI